MPAPPIPLPPFRPRRSRPRRLPMAGLVIPGAPQAGLAAPSLPRSRRRPQLHRRLTRALSKQDFPLLPPPRRWQLHRRRCRRQFPQRRGCSSHRPSRCGDPTRSTARAARRATDPAARSSRMTLLRRRRPCVLLPTRSRRSRSSSDRPVVVQVHVWTRTRRAAASA